MNTHHFIKAITIFCITGMLTGCTSAASSVNVPAEPTVSSSTEAVSTAKPIKQESSNNDAFDTSAVIEEQVLYDEGGIKITAKSLEYESNRAVLFMLIENNTSQTYSVVTGSMGYSSNAINGWMIPDGWFNEDVPAGKKANVHSDFDLSTLKARGIHEIGLIQMSFQISLENDYTNEIETGPIEIQTSAYNSWKDEDLLPEQLAENAQSLSYDMDGEITDLSDGIVYDNHGITVTPLAFVRGEKTAALILEAENTSDEQVNLSIEDLSANGFTLSAGRWDSRFLNPGKKELFDIAFYNSLDEDDWKTMGIETVNDVEFSIQLRDADYNDISASVPIIIHVSDEASSSKETKEEDVLYSDHGITITNKGASEDQYGREMNWNLQIQNDNDYEIYVSDGWGDKLSIGDYMIDYIMWGSYIGAKKTGIATIEIQKDSLEENGIDPFAMGNAEIKLELQNESTYETIDEPTLSADLTLQQ